MNVIPATEGRLGENKNIKLKEKGNNNDYLVFDLKIKLLMKLAHVPSLSMCVIDDDFNLIYKGYGFSKILTGQRPTKDIIYLVASISKTVCATALMQLYEKGLFDLDDDVNKYLDFEVRNPNHPNVPVTFRMLLAHRSSLAGSNLSLDYIHYCFLRNPKKYPYPMIKEMIIPNGSLYKDFIWNSYTPGSHTDYSSISFILLEHLVEVLSKDKFSNYCKNNIFIPLKMENTSFNLHDLKRNQLAIPYIDFFRIFFPLPIVEGIYAAGGLRSSIEDFSHYVIAHMNGGVWNDVRILNESTVDLMHTQQYMNISHGEAIYGLGFRIWFGNILSRFKPYGHAGCGYGMTTYMGINKSNDRAVIFFMNKAFDFSKKIETFVYFSIMSLLYFNEIDY